MAKIALANMPDWPRLMRTKQAEAYTSTTAGALKAEGVKFTRRGKCDLWRKDDLDAWIDKTVGNTNLQNNKNYLDCLN